MQPSVLVAGRNILLRPLLLLLATYLWPSMPPFSITVLLDVGILTTPFKSLVTHIFSCAEVFIQCLSERYLCQRMTRVRKIKCYLGVTCTRWWRLRWWWWWRRWWWWWWWWWPWHSAHDQGVRDKMVSECNLHTTSHYLTHYKTEDISQQTPTWPQ